MEDSPVSQGRAFVTWEPPQRRPSLMASSTTPVLAMRLRGAPPPTILNAEKAHILQFIPLDFTPASLANRLLSKDEENSDGSAIDMLENLPR